MMWKKLGKAVFNVEGPCGIYAQGIPSAPGRIEALNEAAGCLHRTHGVGTRGSDADLEQVEHADGHFSPGIALFLES